MIQAGPQVAGLHGRPLLHYNALSCQRKRPRNMAQWHKRGELNRLPIWESDEGELAIERDFELLCELTPEELAQWRDQQRARRAGASSPSAGGPIADEFRRDRDFPLTP